MSDYDETIRPLSPLTLLILCAIRMGGQGQEEEALDLLGAIIARTGNVFARQELALLYAEMGLMDLAAEEWRIIQEIDPSRPSLETHLMVARVINRRIRRGKDEMSVKKKRKR